MRPCASGTVLKNDLSQAIDRKKVKVYATLSMGPLLRTEMEGCRVELFTQPAVVGPLPWRRPVPPTERFPPVRRRQERISV